MHKTYPVFYLLCPITLISQPTYIGGLHIYADMEISDCHHTDVAETIGGKCRTTNGRERSVKAGRQVFCYEEKRYRHIYINTRQERKENQKRTRRRPSQKAPKCVSPTDIQVIEKEDDEEQGEEPIHPSISNHYETCTKKKERDGGYKRTDHPHIYNLPSVHHSINRPLARSNRVCGRRKAKSHLVSSAIQNNNRALPVAHLDHLGSERLLAEHRRRLAPVGRERPRLLWWGWPLRLVLAPWSSPRYADLSRDADLDWSFVQWLRLLLLLL